MRLKKRLKRLTTLVEGLEVVINGHSRIIQELNDFRNHTNTRLDNQDGTMDRYGAHIMAAEEKIRAAATSQRVEELDSRICTFYEYCNERTDKQEVRIDKLFIQLSKLEKAMSKSSKVKKSRAK